MKVLQLLDTEEKWIKRALAKNINGYSCCYNSKYAKKWCLVGAIYKCYGKPTSFRIISRIEKKLKVQSVAGWNDYSDRTFFDVKNLINELNI